MLRVVDIFYGLPDMLIFILLSLLFVRNIGGLLVPLGLVSWVRFARIARGQVLQTKELLFVESARALGASRGRILLRHIMPNIIGPVIVTLTFSVPSAILAESTLSFIGIGIKSPQTSWGLLVSMGMKQIHTYPLRLFFPAMLICLTMLSLQLIGDGLRDALDPKLRH